MSCRLQVETLPRRCPIQRQYLATAAPLLGYSLFPFTGQEVLHGREDKGTELAQLRGGAGQRAAFEQLLKKRLGQILGIRRRIATAAHIDRKSTRLNSSHL